jgi:hypothetical protein
MDSLVKKKKTNGGDNEHSDFIGFVHNYLRQEYLRKYGRGARRNYFADNLPSVVALVPQQLSVDCAFCVFENVERFFTDPVENYKKIRENSEAFAEWYDPIICTYKRKAVADLIRKCMAFYSPENLHLLPQFNFLEPEKEKETPPFESNSQHLHLLEFNMGLNG